ncbi:hypothetical protein [Neobacillus sp. Marseille-QA0830]
MPTYTVNVYGIFTNGSSSSGTAAQRRARLRDDVRRANEIWRINGESCINFVAAGTFPTLTNTRINSRTRTWDQALREVDPIVDSARRALGGAIAVYIVYLSGGKFIGGDIGGGGVRFEFNQNDYSVFGQVVISNDGFQTDIFAHEVGHILLSRLETDADGNLVLNMNDPTGPYEERDPDTGEVTYTDPDHSASDSNIMYPTIFGTNREIAESQCTIARDSRVVIVTN